MLASRPNAGSRQPNPTSWAQRALPAAVLGAVIAAAGGNASAGPAADVGAPQDAPAGEPQPPPTRPHDPNDAPPMRAPNGQPRHDTDVWSAPTTDAAGRRRRVAVTLQPAFAAMRLAFIGRPTDPIRGLGVIADVDVQVWRTLWLRLSASHSAHPVESVFARNDEDEIVQTAASGVLHATGVAFGAAYAFDLGRVLPLIELGVGGLFVRTPEAVQDGQRGGQCRADGTCDAGLRCGAATTCEVGFLPAVHGGIGFDILLGRHWSAGAGLRYYAIATAPGVFPIYLTGTARIGVRW